MDSFHDPADLDDDPCDHDFVHNPGDVPLDDASKVAEQEDAEAQRAVDETAPKRSRRCRPKVITVDLGDVEDYLDAVLAYVAAAQEHQGLPTLDELGVDVDTERQAPDWLVKCALRLAGKWADERSLELQDELDTRSRPRRQLSLPNLGGGYDE